MSVDVEEVLRAEARKRGATVVRHGTGHFQIQGSLLCNYYPFGRKQTAYVAGTTKGINHVEPAQAVAMAFRAPPIANAARKDKRSRSNVYRRWKRQQWHVGVRLCHWCRREMTLIQGLDLSFTVDHKIPLHRGGLDNANNFLPSCFLCNQERGHNMPELKRAQLAAAAGGSP